ncbi:MAG TPA: hypothetical protein VFT38_11785 [Vicinamibacteria bacterium]|nr:hypothetical protein [Vicinamibacteria bacterium]
MLGKLGVTCTLVVAAGLVVGLSRPVAATPISVYGTWHCGSDFCTWASVRDMTEFDQKNHWIIDRGNGQPSVNIVVLSFVHPVRLMNRVNDAQTVGGVPIGMNQAVVDYFKTRGIRVMLSIGGITYTDAWNQALDTDPVGLAMAASDAANRLGVGIEIDYEENSSPRLAALQTFVDNYRALHPYDPTGSDPTARLTIDLAAGDRWLIDIARKATSDWLATATPVLDYANAMVPSRQPNSASTAQSNWQEHVDGKPQYSPPILPLAPAKFTGSLYIVTGNRAAPECVNFATSLEKSTGTYVQTVAPKTGSTSGMLGYMFWAAECQGTRSICTTPPNSCEGGVGVGATTYAIPIPMPPLRQN